jgi:hypothetical protein
MIRSVNVVWCRASRGGAEPKREAAVDLLLTPDADDDKGTSVLSLYGHNSDQISVCSYIYTVIGTSHRVEPPLAACRQFLEQPSSPFSQQALELPRDLEGRG